MTRGPADVAPPETASAVSASPQGGGGVSPTILSNNKEHGSWRS